MPSPTAQRTGVRLPAPPRVGLMTLSSAAMSRTYSPPKSSWSAFRDAIGAGSLTHVPSSRRRVELHHGRAFRRCDPFDPPPLRTLRSNRPRSTGQARETRALELLQRANIPAPAPIWADREGVFDEPAILISYVDGSPDLNPSNPFDWAEQLAGTLARIHDLRLEDRRRRVVPTGAGDRTSTGSRRTPRSSWSTRSARSCFDAGWLGSARGDIDVACVQSIPTTGLAIPCGPTATLTAVIDWESPATG